MAGASVRPLNFTVRVPVQRPQSVRTLVLVLTLIGVTAFLGILLAPWGRPLPIAPQLLHADPQAAALLIFSAGALYALTTLVCAFALWRMASWGRTSYACFVGSLLLFVALFLYIVRIPAPLGLVLAFFALLFVGLYWGWCVVRGAYAKNRQAL
jgi:hypothetical protein